MILLKGQPSGDRDLHHLGSGISLHFLTRILFVLKNCVSRTPFWLTRSFSCKIFENISDEKDTHPVNYLIYTREFFGVITFW